MHLLGLALRALAAGEGLHAIVGGMRRVLLRILLPQLLVLVAALACLAWGLGFAALAAFLALSQLMPPPLAALAMSAGLLLVLALCLLVAWLRWWRAPRRTAPPVALGASGGAVDPLTLALLALGAGFLTGNATLGRRR